MYSTEHNTYTPVIASEAVSKNMLDAFSNNSVK